MAPRGSIPASSPRPSPLSVVSTGLLLHMHTALAHMHCPPTYNLSISHQLAKRPNIPIVDDTITGKRTATNSNVTS